MKPKIHTAHECLNFAIRACRQLQADEMDAQSETDLLAFASARTWVDRAEFAVRFGEGKIGSGEFECVTEMLAQAGKGGV